MFCFIAYTIGSLCTIALRDDAVGDDGKDISDDSAAEVSHSVDDLTTKVEELNIALTNQDKLLRLAARERKEFQSKYESMLRELESARALVVVSGETECDGCALHMSNIATLQTKYATLIDECDELQSMSSLLGACQTCLDLQIELAEKNAGIASIEKASSVSASTPFVVCTM